MHKCKCKPYSVRPPWVMRSSRTRSRRTLSRTPGSRAIRGNAYIRSLCHVYTMRENQSGQREVSWDANSLHISSTTSGWSLHSLGKWNATPHPSIELWKTRFPCWSEVHILWPLSLTELSLVVPLPEPAGGPPWWRTRPFSIVCRTQRDIFGKSSHGATSGGGGNYGIITVLRFVLHFEGCGWACFLCPHS